MFKFLLVSRRPYNRIIEKFLLKNIKPGSRVVDVGCGTGTSALLLAKNKTNCRVDGVEINRVKVHRANRLFLKAKHDHLVHCHLCAVEDLEGHFGRAIFDYVITNHAIHHFATPKKAFVQMLSILKPGGKILLTDLTPEYGRRVDQCERYSFEEL